jgi:uncharacterized delta-60 repeat protein
VLGQVNAVVIQPDGKVVIAGTFTSINGTPRWNIARLNADGTVDEGFAKSTKDGVQGEIFALALQKDGHIVAGGLFTQSGKSEAKNLVRYTPEGTVDSSFGQALGGQATNGAVLALAVQPDDKIILGGSFSMVYGQERRGVARLNADGTVDELKIGDNVVNGKVQALAATSSSEVIAGGAFTVSGKTGLGLLQVKAPKAP